MAKARPLELRLLEGLRKAYGEDAAILLSKGGFATVREVCPTGMEVLDRWVIGIGGLPWGRIIELSGGEGGGKTTLACKFMSAAQRDGGTVAIRDAENKFDPQWARLHGVDLDRVVMMEALHLEDFIAECHTTLDLCRPGDKPMIVLDSVASLGTRSEMEETDKNHVGEVSRVWSMQLKALSMKNAKVGGIILLINQRREKIGVMYGNPETTPGGNAIKHYAVLRLGVSHGKSVKDGSEHTARYMKVTAIKNQLAPPYRHATLRLSYTDGFDDRYSIVDHAKDVGCLPNGATVRQWKDAMENLGWPLPESMKAVIDEPQATEGPDAE